jgi:hypothetical protein
MTAILVRKEQEYAFQLVEPIALIFVPFFFVFGIYILGTLLHTDLTTYVPGGYEVGVGTTQVTNYFF